MRPDIIPLVIGTHRLVGIPDGAMVMGADWDFERDAIALRVEHASFPEVPIGTLRCRGRDPGPERGGRGYAAECRESLGELTDEALANNNSICEKIIRQMEIEIEVVRQILSERATLKELDASFELPKPAIVQAPGESKKEG